MQNATLKTSLTQNQGKKDKIRLFDLARGLAIIFVLTYHIFLFTGQKNTLTIANGLIENLKRWQNIPNILLAAGYQGVHVFIVLSGFLLTLSSFKKEYKILNFYKKRLKRILIPYWLVFLASLLLIVLSLNTPFIKTFNNPVPYLKILKAAAFPFYFDYSSSILSYINRAWWFLPLILELYLIFPFLFKLLKKLKPQAFLAITLIITLIYRYLAVFKLQGSPIGVVYPSLNGSTPFIIFTSRLFEFSLGMFLAKKYLDNKNLIKNLTSLKMFGLGLLFQTLGTTATFYKSLWTVSDPLIGTGIFLVVLSLGSLFKKIKPVKNLLNFIGSISYPLYLIHYLVLIRFFTPFLSLKRGGLIYLSLMPIYLIIIISLAKIVQILDSKVNKIFTKKA
jgi:peptidoglycan/LPS O-acetylase OafA/YrhL